MAEIIARAASKAGVKNIVMYNISKTHHSYILRDIFRYKGLIVGAPTYNAGLYHEMEVLLLLWHASSISFSLLTAASLNIHHTRLSKFDICFKYP